MKITVDMIKEVFVKEPTLTYAGFATDRSNVESGRNNLLSALSEVQLCYDWLSRQQIGKRATNRDYSSYSLKHAVEFATRGNRGIHDYVYVSNGAFLAAAIIANVPYKRQPGSPNALVAVRRNRCNRRLWRTDRTGYTEFRPLHGVQVETPDALAL